MFKRCAYYFMIGMFGLGHAMVAEVFGANFDSLTGKFGLVGMLLFYLMSLIFLIEILRGFVKAWNEVSTDEEEAEEGIN